VELEFGQRQTTVRVADCEPGAEVPVDFGRLGLLADQGDGRRRVVHGLIFTAVYSRHMFVWPTYRQTLTDVIGGFEAAWVFFSGVFAVVIVDNMKAIVDKADAIDPKLNDAFREYAQARGFAVDPTRIRSPRDKPRVERCPWRVTASMRYNLSSEARRYGGTPLPFLCRMYDRTAIVGYLASV
jgi:transposase